MTKLVVSAQEILKAVLHLILIIRGGYKTCITPKKFCTCFKS